MKVVTSVAIKSLILILAWLGSARLAVEVADRTPPIDYIGARVLTPDVKPGSFATVEFEVSRHRICQATVRRYLKDNAGIVHAITNYTVGPNSLPGREIYNRTIGIPPIAAAGPAIYWVEIDYVCNAVQALGWPIEVESPPAPLNIVPN